MPEETTKPPESETLVPVEEQALAIPDEELNDMFGGPDAGPPVEIKWPEINLTKTDDFEMPDGEKVQELVGHFVWAQKSRAWWEVAYGKTDDGPPNCSSDNSLKPNADIDDPQSGECGDKLCKKATWYKDDDKKNCVDCKESLNTILLLENEDLPFYMRIRSLCMEPKSPLAKFFALCCSSGYALNKKFQTVKVKLTLVMTKKYSFPTSILHVEKISTLTSSDPLLPSLIQMFKKAEEEFVIVHKGETTEAEPAEEYDGREAYEDDETEI